MGYIMIDIGRKDIGYTVGVYSQRVFSITDEVTLFAVTMLSGSSLLVVSNGNQVFLFDKELKLPDIRVTALMFVTVDITNDLYRFDVSYVADACRINIGHVDVWNNGRVTFNGERIGVDKSRLLLSKAVMLCG